MIGQKQELGHCPNFKWSALDKEMSMKTKSQAEAEAQEIVENWVAGAVLTGWIPFSALFLAAADTIMIRQVDMDAVKAHLGGLVAATVGGGVVAEVTGWIPVVGWVAKSIGMGAKAKVIGEVVIEYFREQSPLPD
jgi:hypothetical protein